MQRIALNTIVKNEAANLPRMLDSVRGFVSAVFITDTGSEDATKKIITDWGKRTGTPVHLSECEFIDYSQARNFALERAMEASDRFPFDYLLLCDADMELKVEGPLPELDRETHTMTQTCGGLSWVNTRLIRAGSKERYHGVTHEAIGSPDRTEIPKSAWYFYDHNSGSNRPGKYARDIRLLEAFLKKCPDDGRSLFYLANTYKDRNEPGDTEKAIELYKRRIKVGGWDEEIWYSKWMISRLYARLNNEGEFIRAALDAYNFRASRAEPLHDLAKHFRNQPGGAQAGWAFAQIGSKIEKPGDYLFVENWMYDWGFREEKSILGGYVNKGRGVNEGYRECNSLALDPNVPEYVREGARRNLFWYLKPLSMDVPSFKAEIIPNLNPNPVFTNTNPSVINWFTPHVAIEQIKGIVRTVSYRIREDGTYDYNGEKAIRTTSYLCDFDPETLQVTKAVEVKRPQDMPVPVFDGVLDAEDLRPVQYKGKDDLYASCTILEQNKDAWREQFLLAINPDGRVPVWHRMDPKWCPKRHEKNWAPIVGDRLQFMYSPGVVCSPAGERLHNNPPALAVDQFSGGSQLLPFEAGWITIIHEARPDPRNGKRHYHHRFVWYDKDFVLQKISLPFYFFDKQIEFAAGMCYLAPDKFLISFGVLDREAWLATVKISEVRTFLWQ